MDLADRVAGTLLGTALGDALGLPAEGMGPAAIARRFGRLERFRLLGSRGFVSDDTEQSALVAQSLARFPADPEGAARAFKWALLGWFLRLPWGIGLATVRACFKIAIGLRRTGIRSAGNGAAMRAAVIGAVFHDRPEDRWKFGVAIAEVTHLDPRAVEGAKYVAELAAWCATHGPTDALAAGALAARVVVREPTLGEAIDRAVGLARDGKPVAEAAAALGTTGFVMHTVPFATYAFVRFGHGAPVAALAEAISAGGDTDSFGAILGAWLGALNGERGLPADLLARIHDGPFGPSHLRALAAALVAARAGATVAVPRYSALGALLRNLALYPVIIGHGLRRLVPF